MGNEETHPPSNEGSTSQLEPGWYATARVASRVAATTTAVFASGTVFFVFAGSLLWTWLGGVWPFPGYVTAGMVPLLGCVMFLLNPFGKWWLRAIAMAYLILADGWYIADGGGVVGYFFAVLILSSIPHVVLERRKG